MKRLECVVEGRVQGVGYRFFAQARARALNLNGFVRNLPNGDVEAIAEGSEDALKSFLDALAEGPSLSKVVKVNPVWKEAKSEFGSFSIKS